ncbi:MAG: peptidase [Microbacterium sp.]|jgi:divalent metal cation (Fe/Co/Zn/Cd) transporter|nr:peptidase [Microbacterium sp.]
MSIEINWIDFGYVFAAALIGAVAIVLFYSLGLRMLVRAGRIPVVSPAEFTDAITVLTDKEIRRAEKQAAKAAKKSPLTDAQKTLAFLAAIGCFILCGLAVLGGIALIVIGH